MTTCKQLEVRTEDRTPQKWCVALREDVFDVFLSQGGSTVQKVFGDGSLFSPMLFGNFFDPSDAFPLWEFDSEILLSNLRSTGQTTVDWFQTDKEFVLKAELPGIGNNSIQVYLQNGKVLEICGQWMQQKESKMKDWRTSHWWEHGFVRRLELPEKADPKKTEAYIMNDIILEIRILKSNLDCDNSHGNGGAIKDGGYV
ncbi:Alpha crystallin/Hsp20 domain [Dillenia turbinata]|uniref:Alpha crystallin/Hsp20 domain n=1 Tax=Dillenia turbinata TaxID=194707 RepID=A0AAN8ZU12_9MAGN